MATEVIKTIRASGGDYTTLSAWEAALPASLVTADEQHTAVCYNDWPSGLNDVVDVSGITTDASRYARITVADGHSHGGVKGAGFFMAATPGGNLAGVISCGASYTVVDRVEVRNTRSSAGRGIRLAATYVRVDACLAYGNNAVLYESAGGVSPGSDWAVITNTLGADFGSSSSTNSRYKALNCISLGGYAGATNNKPLVTNCIAIASFSAASSYQTGSDYNASADSSANTFTNYVTGVSSSDFIDSDGDDYRLASDSALIGAGINLYSTFTTDIDGDIRPSSGAWDIGFDHYVASGGTNTDTAAGSGSIAIAGSATAALRTHLGAAASGSTAVTGSAANGVYTPVGALTSAADSGSISVTSVAAIGKHDYLTAAGLGSITVTGSAANAAKSLGATAGAGSIALTGSSTLAIRAWLSGAETGSVAITGSSAIGVKAAPGTGTLDPSTIAAIADAVWGHADAIAAHAALDDILARVTC